jgi:hypothetical protein
MSRVISIFFGLVIVGLFINDWRREYVFEKVQEFALPSGEYHMQMFSVGSILFSESFDPKTKDCVIRQVYPPSSKVTRFHECRVLGFEALETSGSKDGKH